MIRYISYFIIFAFCFSSSASSSYDEKESKHLAEKLINSVQVSKSLPFHGTLTYIRKTEKNTEKIKFNISRLSEDEKIVTILSPEPWKGNILYRNKNGLWVTPLDDDLKNKVSKDTRHYLWDRVVEENETIHFDKLDAIVRNYKLYKKGFDEVANQKVIEIEIKSKHKGRPDIYICLDKENLKQIKYVWEYPCGNNKETFEYEEISYEKHKEIKPPDVSQLHQIFSSDDEREVDVVLDFVPLVPEKLPEGFNTVSHNRFKKRDDSVYYTTYSDGIARMTVYQRKLSQKEIEENQQENQNPAEPIVKKVIWKGREIFFYDKNDLRLSAVGDISEHGIIKTLLSMTPEK